MPGLRSKAFTLNPAKREGRQLLHLGLTGRRQSLLHRCARGTRVTGLYGRTPHRRLRADCDAGGERRAMTKRWVPPPFTPVPGVTHDDFHNTSSIYSVYSPMTGQRDRERSPAVGIVRSPYSSAVSFDDGATDRQAQSQSVPFAGDEGFENTLKLVRWNSFSAVLHFDQHF